MKTIHLLQAVHADGCKAKGTKRVTVKIEETTCARCKRWYWHSEGLVVADHVKAELGMSAGI